MKLSDHHPAVRQLEDGVTDALRGYTDEELFARVPFNEEEAERTGSASYSYWRSTFRAFRHNVVAMVVLALLVIVVVFTLIQPLLPGQFSPTEISKGENGMPLKNTAPDSVHLMGTNATGQDLWSRVWAGTRNSLLISFTVAIIEAVVGILVGVLWGYVRWLDYILTEIYNIVDNVPSTLVLILLSLILRPGVFTIIFALTITGWIGMARFIRNQVLIIRDREYNIASRTLGTSTGRIIFRNLLPYLVSVIMLRMALSIPGAIGSEVFVTYIGLGVPIETCTLGNLISTSLALISTKQAYQLIFPVVVVSFITVSFYIVGNAFSDAADPRNHV